MNKFIFVPILVFLISSANGGETATRDLKEIIKDPSERCEAQYIYINAPSDEKSVTEISVKCGSQMSIIWQAEGIGHQITIEWLREDKLKITYHPELKVLWQEIGMTEVQLIPDSRDANVRRIEIEYDPPFEEEKAVVLDESNWPIECDEAAQLIFSELDNDSIQTLKEAEKDNLIMYHHGWGTGIRNWLGLWRGNNDLMKSCMKKEPHSQDHPDTVLMIIIELVWDLVQNNRSE